MLIDRCQGVVGALALRCQHANRLDLQCRPRLSLGDLADQRLGLRRLTLRQHKQRPALQLVRLVATQDFLQDRHRLLLVLLHQRIQGQQLQVLVGLSLRRYGLAALAPDFDLQRATLIQPPALRIALPQFAACAQRIRRLSFLIFRVSLPVERALGVLAMHLRHAIEQPHRVGPAALVYCACPVGIQARLVGAPASAVRDQQRLHHFSM